jgi:hypothetical protein
MEKSNTEVPFSYEEGLKTIYNMIESTRGNIGQNYRYFLLWGYLVAFACILEFLFIRVYPVKYHYLVWPVLIGAGVVLSTVMTLWQRRTQTHKTLIDNMMTYLWGGWLVTLLLLQLFANLRNDYNLILPLTMAMYGMGVFVSGGIIKFRPLIYGGILSWVSAVISFFQPHDVQLLITTGTLVIGYIIPGYILGGLAKQQKS